MEQAMSSSALVSSERLNVFVSSRHYPHISIRNCGEVWVEHNNGADISDYIMQNVQIVHRQDGIYEASLSQSLPACFCGQTLSSICSTGLETKAKLSLGGDKYFQTSPESWRVCTGKS